MKNIINMYTENILVEFKNNLTIEREIFMYRR